MNTPEKLNLWDRLFNRYTRTIEGRGASQWTMTLLDSGKSFPYHRAWVEYRVTDRLTGSQTLERKYLSDCELT